MIDREPFIIRAHHALDASVFTLNNAAPARTLIDLSASHTNGVQAMLKFPHPDSYRYARDVLGDDPKNFSKVYKRRLYEFYKDYAMLDDSYPVQLTTTLDRMCLACAIGNHCRQSDIDGDRMAIELFVNTARWMGLSEEQDFSVIKENNQIIRLEAKKKTIVEVVGSVNAYCESIQERG